MRATTPFILSAAFATALLYGCAGSGRTDLPSWILRAQPDAPEADMVYAVGSAGYDPNPALQLDQARQSARTELARECNSYVAGLINDFMQSHRDYADPKKASSIQFVNAVSKSVAEAQLEKSQQVNQYTDPGTKTLYVLVSMPADVLRKNAAEYARRVAAGQSPFADTEKALTGLETYLSSQYGIKRAEPPAPEKPAPEKPEPKKPAPAKPEKPTKPEPTVAAAPSLVIPKGPAPDWIRTRSHPQYPHADFMLGVGMGPTVVQADKAALADLGGQIRVKVENTFREVVESWRKDKAGASTSSVISDTVTRVDENLAATKTVETWQDGGSSQFYSLVVMNRAKAGEQFSETATQSLKAAQTSLDRAEGNLGDGKVSGALTDLKRAMESVAQYMNCRFKLQVVHPASLETLAPLPATLEIPALWDRMEKIMQATRLEVDSGDNQRVNIGEPLALPLAAKLVYRGTQPLTGVRIVFAFDGGKGEMQTEAWTDKDGVAKVRVSRAQYTGQALNTVVASVDEASLELTGLNLTVPKPVRFTYRMPTPATSKIAVYIIEQDTNGKPAARSIVQDQTMQALAEAGFKVADETTVASRAKKAQIGGLASDADLIKALADEDVNFIVFGTVRKEVRQEEQRAGGFWIIVEALASIRVIDVGSGKVVGAMNPKALGTLNTANRDQALKGAEDGAGIQLSKKIGPAVVEPIKNYFK